MKSRRSTIYDLLLLCGLCLLFFWRDLTPVAADRVTFRPGDFIDQFYAYAPYATARLGQGQLPLWNPFSFAGHPFLADIQAGVFYPVSLIRILATVGRELSSRALELEALVHFPLAAAFTYLLARRLTGARAGGLMAAIVFTFGGYLTSYPVLQLPILETVVWLPLLLLCLDLAAAGLARGARRTALGWTIAAGIVFGVLLLAGHPQSAMLVGYAGLAFSAYRFWPRRRDDATAAGAALRQAHDGAGRSGLHDGRWRLGLILIWVVIGAGLSAIQIIPSLEFMRLSARSSLGFEEAGRGMLPYDLLQFIYPAIGGEWPALYVGLLPLGLAALALTVVRRDSRTPARSARDIGFLGWSLALAVLLVLGKATALYQLFHLFAPGWRQFRCQERAAVWVAMAAALLAGYGAAWLARRWQDLRTARPDARADPCGARPHGGPEQGLVHGLRIAIVALLVLAAAFFVGYQAGAESLWGFAGASLWMALLLLLAALALRSRRPALLIAVALLDLFTVNATHHAVPVGAIGPAGYESLLAIPLQDRGVFRMASEGALPDSYGLLHSLEDVGGASPMQLRELRSWLEALPPERAWRMLNVAYVVSWREALGAPAERLAEGQSADGRPIHLHRLEDPAPRAWLAGEVLTAAGFDEALRQLAAATFDPARQVVLGETPAGFEGVGDCSGTVDWHLRTPESLALSVTSQGQCILVLSELDYPGWTARVDNAATPILRADGILRAVAIKPGRHEVEFRFRPASVIGGAAVSIGSLLIVIVALVVLAARRSAEAGVDGEVLW